MADELYERYKGALRSGHVAVLRGRLEEAASAYAAAAEIAPNRALPQACLGGVYLRLGRIDEALERYAAAVELGPDDEGALLGRAEALLAAGRRPEAALALDRVAAIQAAADRIPEAVDTLRRGMELDPRPSRRRRQLALIEARQPSAGEEAAEQALAATLRPLDEEIAEETAPEAGPTGLPGEPDEAVAARGADGASAARAAGDVAEAGEAAGDVAEAGEAAAIGLPLDDGPSADDLQREVEAAEAAGDLPLLRSLLLDSVRAFAREGRFDAALDAAQAAIGLQPSDVDLHLALVDVYIARGWQAVAAEKVALLDRLASLDGDETTRLRVAAAAEGLPAQGRRAPSGRPGRPAGDGAGGELQVEAKAV